MIVYRELSSLEQDLGIPAKTLYAVSNQLGRHYQEVLIPKRDGSTRKLFVPDKLLKHIQRRICDTLLVPIPISRYATAYHYGSSVLKNAQPHVGAPVILKLDILHFFDSIRYCHVKDSAFPPEIYAEPLGFFSPCFVTTKIACRKALPPPLQSRIFLWRSSMKPWAHGVPQEKFATRGTVTI